MSVVEVGLNRFVAFNALQQHAVPSQDFYLQQLHIMPGGLHPPISVVLSWQPNLIDPPTRSWALVITVAVLLALTYIVVGLRIWARFGIAKNWGIDDVLIMFNMVSGL
jgi:hypothetical protein